MKKVSEMTEQEIMALSDEEVKVHIKFRMAEEGVKLVAKPKPPEYFKVDAPDKPVFKCGLFGDDLVFDEFDELNELLNTIQKMSVCRSEYDYNRSSSDVRCATAKLKSDYSFKTPYEIKTTSIYSRELYGSIVDLISRNKTMKDEYTKEVEAYNEAIDSSMWIEDEVKDKVNMVRNKYYALDQNLHRFKNDYLPLSGDDETIAMNFLKKAYSINEETEAYILNNYKNE